MNDQEHVLKSIVDLGVRHAEPAERAPHEPKMVVVDLSEGRRAQRVGDRACGRGAHRDAPVGGPVHLRTRAGDHEIRHLNRYSAASARRVPTREGWYTNAPSLPENTNDGRAT